MPRSLLSDRSLRALATPEAGQVMHWDQSLAGFGVRVSQGGAKSFVVVYGPNRIRKTIIELLMAHAPDAPQLQDLAKEYGAEKNRFEKDASFCIHCGLCVRYCAEVKKKNAVGFVDRGIRKEISFIPEIASKECNDCKECFPLCPTSYLQAVFVLTESLVFPSDPINSKS